MALSLLKTGAIAATALALSVSGAFAATYGTRRLRHQGQEDLVVQLPDRRLRRRRRLREGHQLHQQEWRLVPHRPARPQQRRLGQEAQSISTSTMTTMTIEVERHVLRPGPASAATSASTQVSRPVRPDTLRRSPQRRPALPFRPERTISARRRCTMAAQGPKPYVKLASTLVLVGMGLFTLERYGLSRSSRSRATRCTSTAPCSRSWSSRRSSSSPAGAIVFVVGKMRRL